MKTDSSRTIFLGIMSGPTGCDDSFLTSLFELVGTEARREANGRMRRQQGALQQILLVSVTQSIDYPHKWKFSFQSVLANIYIGTARHTSRSQLNQSFEASTASSYLVAFQRSSTRTCRQSLLSSID
jgi:hypothetical protein